MEKEYIETVSVNEKGILCIKPQSRSFDMIYRSAMGVHWDKDEGCLIHNPPDKWGVFQWYQQIIKAVKDEYGVELRLLEETRFENLKEEDIARIKLSEFTANHFEV